LVCFFVGARDFMGGGVSVVCAAAPPNGVRFTLRDPWSCLFLDDARVVHETTPIQPAETRGEAFGGHRDTLVLTFRGDGFQSAP
jgi:hypothetical protein